MVILSRFLSSELCSERPLDNWRVLQSSNILYSLHALREKASDKDTIMTRVIWLGTPKLVPLIAVYLISPFYVATAWLSGLFYSLLR